VLTIVLSARKQELWLYYAFMATVGSVIGGFVTYRLARKGGKETLECKFPARTLQKVYRIFARWGFGAIAIVALLPPPAPMVVFVFAAGAMQYSVNKFLVALTLGRIVRYSLLAFLAARYGRQVLTVVSQHGHPVLIAVIGLIAAAMAGLIFILVNKRKK
jgi:membrane protein YqaA with SNARE-associated domain